MRQDGCVSATLPPAPDPLTAVLLDIERHAAASGWDQPWRVFALVDTASLLAHEPALAETLGPDTTAPWTPVEQDQLPEAVTLEELLHQLAWPETVVGAALVVERVMLPAEVEGELPENQVEILRAIAEHPQRQEMRLAVAVLRDGARSCALRFRSHDDERSVLSGESLAPRLTDALSATFDD
jgi:hypothetical protein